jgi:hypothetical protein
LFSTDFTAGSDLAALSAATAWSAFSIWYDKANLWVRGEFERDGSKVQYQLDA